MFNSQPVLFSSTLHLRPFESDDLDALCLAASAPEIWEGHPEKDRHQRAVFEPYARWLQNNRTIVVIDSLASKIIGCSRYYMSPERPDGIAIGFTFLQSKYWGGSTNFELKRMMLTHAFRSFDEVGFHIAPSNLRSQKATAKLGAEHVGDAVLDISGTKTLWMCFRLTRTAWE